MLLGRKKPTIGREAMFRSKPTRNDSLDWEKGEDGEITITLKRADTWKIKVLSKVFWIPDKRTLVLDPVGGQVWDMCDGRTTVEAMIRKLSETHKLNKKEAEISLLAYLKQLGKKNLVGFIVDKKDLPRRKSQKNPSGKAWGK